MYRSSNQCFIRHSEYKKKPQTLTLVSGVFYLNDHKIKIIILSIFHSSGPLWYPFQSAEIQPGMLQLATGRGLGGKRPYHVL